MTFKVKKEDPLNKLLRIAKYRFIKDEELSPHLLDPKGNLIYYVISCVELYFGREARDLVERRLRPKQRVRILQVLQKLSLESRLELVVPSYRKRRAVKHEKVEGEHEKTENEDLDDVLWEEEEEEVDEDVEDFKIPI